jgi:ubiquinone/menaquinone biosynthesis C-methylase UbiE
MDEGPTLAIRESYDRLADEYARRLVNELQQKPLDRKPLSRFAREVAYLGEICDMGCGPGHIARYLRDGGAMVFGLDLSPRMLEQARQLYPDIRFCEGNMMALDLPTDSLAGIVAFYAIVNIPKKLLTVVFREMHRVLQPGGFVVARISYRRRNALPAGVVGPAYLNEVVLLPNIANSGLTRGCAVRCQRGYRAHAVRA